MALPDVQGREEILKVHVKCLGPAEVHVTGLVSGHEWAGDRPENDGFWT